MTKKELIKALENIGDDEVIVCADENGGWGNIKEIGVVSGGLAAIIWGLDALFSDGG